MGKLKNNKAAKENQTVKELWSVQIPTENSLICLLYKKGALLNRTTIQSASEKNQDGFRKNTQPQKYNGLLQTCKQKIFNHIHRFPKSTRFHW